MRLARRYRGLACFIAVCWDTQSSPVDARTLWGTAQSAIGTLSTRTERLTTAYLSGLGADLHPDAVMFRNKSGNPYREDSLAHDFAAVRELAFLGDNRRLMDMRRSGVVEAIARRCRPLALSAKLVTSIQQSNALHRTYAPVDIEAACSTDEARLRCRIRAGNESKSNQLSTLVAN